MSADQASPVVSVIMANFNGGAHLAAAVRSVLRQTLTSLELILCDDGSRDASLEIARAVADGDPRLVIVQGGVRTGPAAARNRGLRQARGRWIAIVDSDDLIHPTRLETLIGAAERDCADIVADDLLVFYENAARPHAFLKGAMAAKETWVSAADYVLSNVLYSSRPSLGYLKPLIRKSALQSLTYDESLRIAEDYQLIADLLLAGARMRLYPELLYFYRKHSGSISHRLSAADLDAMLVSHDRQAERAVGNPETSAAMARRRASLADARAFTDLVAALKSVDVANVLKTVRRRPAALWILRSPVLDRLSAVLLKARDAPSADPGRRIALLSRQRVVSATNGSSAYVLGLARALADVGFAVDFIGASPKVFGRWPVFRLRPEISVFSSYRIHGGLRVGPFVWSMDPRVAVRGGLAAAAILLRKLAPSWSLRLKPADYAPATPARRSDLLFVARHARPGVCVVLCDYAFLTPLAPYVLAPDAPVATIMHDLMSARINVPALERAPNTIVGLDAAAERRLLSLSDLVVAIQAEEEAKVRAWLPSVATVVAPLASPIASEPQPGDDDTVLFVGSNTAANVTGLQWFLDACWPTIAAARPNAKLLVAGSVGRTIASAPPGVRLLGVVPSLDDLYRSAGVVVAPLKTGSGLKIKLVEALSAGKAVVGAPVAAQGVVALVERAMTITDDPAEFAATVIRLVQDRAARQAAGEAALACAAAHFSPEACYGPLLRSLEAEIARRSRAAQTGAAAGANAGSDPLQAAVSQAASTK